ncbi:MAG: TolC family protein [Pseudomonadota bacterium]
MAPGARARSSSIRYALEHSFAIQQAQERIREQDGLILEVKSVVLPRATVNASTSTIDEDLLQPETNENSWAVGIQVRQALYSGGGLSAAIRAQDAVREAALYDLQTVIEQVVLDVKIRYYDVLLARESIEVQEENIVLLNDQLTNARNRFEAGSVSRFDVLQAEVTVANARPALIRARNSYRIALDEFRRAIGYQNTDRQNVAKVPEFLGELFYEPIEYELIDALNTALSKRPEINQLDFIIDAQESAVDNARSGYRPNVDLVAGYDFRSDTDFASLREYLHGWNIGLQASWAVWDGRATRGRVVQARSQLRQAELQVDETKLAIEVEVRRAISSLQEAEELVEAATKVVEQAEEALRLADARYSAGAGTQLNVLSARFALTDARTNQLQANYSHLIAVANFERSVGNTQYRVTQ